MPGIKRKNILLPLLEQFGVKGFTNENFWNALCPNDTSKYDFRKCRRLDKIRKDSCYRWKRSKRMSNFKSDNQEWLEEDFTCNELPECLIKKQVNNDNTNYENRTGANEVDSPINSCYEIPWVNIEQPSSIKRKRKRKTVKPYLELSTKGKQRRNKHVFKDIETSQLVDEFKSRFNSPANRDIIDSIYCNLKNGERILNAAKSQKPIRFTTTEGFSLMSELGLTHEKYMILKKKLMKKNVHIMPSLKDIKDEKFYSYPKNIISTNRFFLVPLQEMLNHTAERLVEILPTYGQTNGQTKTWTLLSKAGFDGQGGRNHYNVQNETDCDYSSIMHTALVPLKMTNSENKIVWINTDPNSIRTCRPLRIAWEKENNDSIKIEFNRLKTEYASIQPTEYIYKDEKYKVNHIVIFTMFDGKSVSVLTNTPSNMTCPNCKANPKDFNDLERVMQFKVDEDSLSFGISPLHMLIRALEYILHVSYRLDLTLWRVPKELQPQMLERKNAILKSFKDFAHWIIDKVRAGQGNYNTGNLGRKVFSNYDLTASITGINIELIRNLHYMLTAINSGFHINVEAFREIGLRTYKLHIQHYNWYKLPQSMHRLFLHLPQIAEKSQATIGQCSEEAIESSHKCTLYALNHHSRQNSYEKMTRDIGHYRLIHTDPIITRHFEPPIVKNKKKPKPLEKGVTDLLIMSEQQTFPAGELIDIDENIDPLELIVDQPLFTD